MSRRILEFVAEFRRIVHVEIDIPDGASGDTVASMIDPLDADFRQRVTMAYPSLDRRFSRSLKSPAPPPPEWAWVTIGDRRWATDGACVVVEGAPAALASDGAWREASSVDPLVREFLARAFTTRSPAPETTSFRRRFAPLFEHADDAWWSKVAPRVVPAVLARDGLVFAVVMPTEAGPWEDGRDFRPFDSAGGAS